MSDNPFDEDSDRTVIRPAPGGRRTTPPPAADPFAEPSTGTPVGGASGEPQRRQSGAGAPRGPAPARSPAPIMQGETEAIVLGVNPLVAAAGPLLALIGRLARTYSQPNPADLRERTLQQIRAFEDGAVRANIPREQVVKARYVLCASLDDVAQNTEWGRDGQWASRPLVAGFREGVRGYEGIQAGVGFFRLLAETMRSPGTELPLLELMYLCLSLGFLGELRVDPRPMAALDRKRQDLFTVITNQRQAADPALSPHWQGANAPYKPPRAVVPSWVIGVAALTLIGGLFVWLSTGLNAASDDVFDRMLGAPLAHLPQIVRSAPVRPPPPPQQQVEAPEPLYVFLKPEIDQGLVTVLGDHAMPVVRIRNRGLFASGSATVASGYVHLLERIGLALKAEKGPVQVIGYTDNQPIRTVQFPSNYQLSKVRADAASAIIVRTLGEPGRVTVEGLADADPIASNSTPEGRDDNRRIEVVLRRQG
jgi:type VI secretion system protein ImpK